MSNNSYIAEMIEKKISRTPFHPTEVDAEKIRTDMNHHPYTRFYRGKPYENSLVVFERESGYSPITQQVVYRTCDKPEEIPPPKVFFDVKKSKARQTPNIPKYPDASIWIYR